MVRHENLKSRDIDLASIWITNSYKSISECTRCLQDLISLELDEQNNNIVKECFTDQIRELLSVVTSYFDRTWSSYLSFQSCSSINYDLVCLSSGSMPEKHKVNSPNGNYSNPDRPSPNFFALRRQVSDNRGGRNRSDQSMHHRHSHCYTSLLLLDELGR